MMNNTVIDRLTIFGFLSVLLCMAALFLLLPKSLFSELENRKLQTLPSLSWETLVSHTFTEQFESYITDHFPFREQWVSTKSLLEQLRLQQENNGIFLGKDGYLFEKFTEPDFNELERYVNALTNFSQNHTDVRMKFILAPTSIGMYPDRLPWLATTYSQEKVHQWIAATLGEELTLLDGFEFLQSAAAVPEHPIYYRTDHHWTSYGAYWAYHAYAQELGWEPMELSQFQVDTVTRSFLGSLDTRGQFYGTTPDSIQVYHPLAQIQTDMYIADTGETRHAIYDDSFLEKKDKYAYFQGGVHALTLFTNELSDSQIDLNKLLVVKDSYAHSMLPFLTNHVREIHMIDIRFYNGIISDYMEENHIEDVLLLFNTSTFVSERNLLKLNY